MASYTLGEMAKKLGVSTKTLQNWDRCGRFKALRTVSNRRYYTHEQFLEASNLEKYKSDGTDLDAVRGKVVLLTGGTGSLGNAVTSRICDAAKKIIIFSRDELKQSEMRQKFGDKNNIRFILGDVRDKEKLSMALKNVDVCIHAAAQKRIEFCSYNPFMAVENNIIGSMNVVKACLENNVKKALMVSTDKSCNTATLYGATKFTSEQMFIYSNNYSYREGTIFTCIRYGNIYGSRGSIKHLFDRQAREDGEISITHKDMTRFFMSLNDSVNLVLFALNNCIGGEIFVPKMKAIKVMDFAESLHPNIPKKIIGLRGHEKIHEELISETESRYVVECNNKYYKIIPPSVNLPGIGWDINYPKETYMRSFKYVSNGVEILTKEELECMDLEYEEKNEAR
jgi:UDP-N-acetylglucosamine 4,6-dehydratase